MTVAFICCTVAAGAILDQ